MKAVGSGIAAAVLNEVINGFESSDYMLEYGLARQTLIELMTRANQISSTNNRAALALTQEQSEALAKVFRRTLADLGTEEFQTRTGYTLEQGRAEAERLGD